MVIRFKALDAVVKRGFRACGLDVQRLDGALSQEAVIRNLLRTFRVVAVLDVGANVGQYASTLRELGYRDLIVSFEALQQVHAELQRRASSDPLWRVAPRAALASTEGSAQINVAANTVSSSLLPMGDTHLLAAPNSAYSKTESVQLVRLDVACQPLVPDTGDIYLKIDTQGYELEVLKGSTAILNRVAALQLELSLVSLYDGAPTLSELVPIVESMGFEMFGIVPGFKDPRTGRLLQADGFFVRKGWGKLRTPISSVQPTSSSSRV